MTTTCYGVDGTPDKVGRYIPCNTTAVEQGGHTGCCAPGDNCLTNGLCQGQGDNARKANLFWRNGCTDPTWQDPACGRHCVGIDQPDTHAVFYCLTGSSWCCSTGAPDFGITINTTCCTISNLEFEATSPVVYTQAMLNFVSTATDSMAAQTGSLTATGLRSIATTGSTKAASSSTSAPSSSSSSSSSSSGGSNSKTGIYVGVPLGIILALALGVIAWLVLKRRKSSPRHELAGGGGQYDSTAKRPWLFEAGYERRPSELPHNQPAVELPDGRIK